MNIHVIYQGEDLLVVDKPAGIETTAGPSGETSLETRLGQKNVERHGIVHRLDKDTSGVLILTKTQSAYDTLKEQFQNHTINKMYTTLVWGLTNESGEITTPLARDPKRKQAMKAISYSTGLERGQLREALTAYEKIKSYKAGESNVSLLEVKIKTGRTHQIRVHLQSIGHPVLGDKMYFSRSSQQFSQKIGLTRQFLHASQIEFINPATKKKMSLVSPLPSELQNILNSLT